MTTLNIDSHRYVKRLRDSGMPELQAETIFDVMVDVREADLSGAASKSDIDAVQASIAFSQRETGSSISAFRAETESSINALRAETKAEISALRFVLKTEMTEGFARVDRSIARLEGVIEGKHSTRNTVLAALAVIATILAAPYVQAALNSFLSK